MRKSFILSLLVLLFLIPIVRADEFPFFLIIYMANIIYLLIPVVFIETIVTYFYIKKYLKFKITFSRLCGLLLLFLIANITSVIVGFALFRLLSSVFSFLGSLFGLGGFSLLITYSLFLQIIFVILAYVFTSLIESFFIYYIINYSRRKSKKIKKKTIIDSLKLSFFINFVSYLFMNVFLIYFLYFRTI
jgi:hypothetical protein